MRITLLPLLSLLALAATLPPAGIKDTLWPTYAGYAGNQGEKTLSDFVEKNYVRVKTESRRVLNDYFVSSRNSPPRPAVWSWGIASGGLTFLPIVAAGVVGALAVVAARSAALIWLAVLLLVFRRDRRAAGLTGCDALLEGDLRLLHFAGEGALLLGANRKRECSDEACDENVAHGVSLWWQRQGCRPTESLVKRDLSQPYQES